MLTEYLKTALGIPELIAAQKALEKRFEELDRMQHLPEWISLRQSCDIAGISYESIRRPENRHLQPGHGHADAVIQGVRKWRKTTVLAWIEGFGK